MTRLTRSKFLRVISLRCVSVLLVWIVLFAILEAGFQVAKAIHIRSIASRTTEQSWIVYDEDLVYVLAACPLLDRKAISFVCLCWETL